MQTTTCKRAACGLAVPPYQRAKPIYLPSNATDANSGPLGPESNNSCDGAVLAANNLRVEHLGTEARRRREPCTSMGDYMRIEYSNLRYLNSIIMLSLQLSICLVVGWRTLNCVGHVLGFDNRKQSLY